MGMLGVDSWGWLGRVGLTKPPPPTNTEKKKRSSSTTTTFISSDATNGNNNTIGVVAFEVARLMSRAIHLWHSLSDDRILQLRAEVFRSEGIIKLVSTGDDDLLPSLALSEFLDSLRSLAGSVARLGTRCADPALRHFNTVFFFVLVRNGSDPYGLRYAGRKMERKVRKMERLVAATCSLYQELEVMADLEHTLRRMQARAGSDPDHRRHGGPNNNIPICRVVDLRHKVAWQRQELKSLQDASLWNRTYDYAVRLLARSLFNIVARINHVFGFRSPRCGVVDDGGSGPFFESTDRTCGGRRNLYPTVSSPPPPLHSNWKKNKWAVSSRSFNGCILDGANSPISPRCMPARASFHYGPRAVINGVEDADGETRLRINDANRGDLFECLQKPLKAPPSTLGAAALALHYANVILVIEKLAASPHLIGPDARDELYGMLPASIRAALRARLKSRARNLNSSSCDPILAAEWSEALTRILDWLAPLAHNMIRWKSERNFEHQHAVLTANVLLLQTLCFANQSKAEAAITELLVGLDYLWRFGKELDEKAILDCASCRSLHHGLNSEGGDRLTGSIHCRFW